jgi:probable F420-dependent oxidoreductase
VEIGIVMFPADYAIRPDELARACEERGFESLWFPEHTHIPAERRTPWPGGGDLPKEYSHTYDPFVALMAAAAVTRRLRVGTGICLVVERDPITLAKEVASLDQLSDGRFLFGIGGGWNAEEMENHGVPFAKRWKVVKEKVEAMKRIWTEEEASYRGEFVRFERIWSWPKPRQKPHPPIVMGGNTAAARRKVAEYCDGYLPIAPLCPRLEEDLADLRALAERAGRDPNAISVSLYGASAEKRDLERYARAGVDRAILSVPAESRDRVLPRIDRYAELVAGTR